MSSLVAFSNSSLKDISNTHDIFKLRTPEDWKFQMETSPTTMDSFLASAEGIYKKMVKGVKVEEDVKRIDSKIGIIESGIADIQTEVQSTGSLIEEINQRIDKLDAMIGNCETSYLNLFTDLEIESKQNDEEVKQMWDDVNTFYDEQVSYSLYPHFFLIRPDAPSESWFLNS